MSGLTVEQGSQIEVVEVEGSQTLLVDDGEIEIVSEGQAGPPGPVGTTNPVPFIVAYSPTITIDWASGDIAVLTLSGNAVISMTGTRKKVLLRVTQGAGGGFSLTYDATVAFGSDIPGMALSSAAGKTDYIGFAYNELTGKFDVIAFARGY